MIQYREVYAQKIDRSLFAHFTRRQAVVNCVRREAGEWKIIEDPFIDDWSEEDYQTLVRCLRNTVQTGGFVYAAFDEDVLKGFVSVEAMPLGNKKEYLDLSSLHVSADWRGKGIGRKLFVAAKRWAKEKGAKKLYISSHSAVETQAFYRAMGCVEAMEYNQKHAEAEPYDCQLECAVE